MLKVDNLSIFIKEHLVKDISFTINAGEFFALIGESGSGKSLTALGLMRLLPRHASYGIHSKILLSDQDLLNISEREMRAIRGKSLGMIFQDPMTSLNPVLTVGEQLRGVLRRHGDYTPDAPRELLARVQIVRPNERLRCYPHELSGGMKQRVMIAMALACRPQLLIADEPTTALDVTTQAEIMTLLREICTEQDMAILFITHDLALASHNADRIAVMRLGRMVEQAPTNQFFVKAHNPYSQNLLNALPSRLDLQLPIPSTQPVLEVSNLQVNFPIEHGFLRKIVGVNCAVDNISLTLNHGETLAIVGESGSGKTTLGKALLGLIPEATGIINTHGSKLQVIFQDPYSSLNPKLRVVDSLCEGIYKDPHKLQVIDNLLLAVGLLPEHKWRFPHEFSGGERQRLCIARALTVEPQVIICDEPTSSLDVSIQAQVLELLVKLQKEFNLAYLFITHDISLVKLLAHRVAVMYQGRIVEQGITSQVLADPQHEYTRKLLSAVPVIN